MLRLRLFRILLPALLLLLGGVVAYNLKAPGGVHTAPSTYTDTPTAEVLKFIEWTGEQRSVTGDVALIQDAADGSLHLEGIRNLEIQRKDGGVLVISAREGDREGLDGERVWHFNEEVIFEDPEERLTLTLPVLEVDEAAGEARSEGEILFDSSQGHGTATSVLYGLHGQPGQISDPRIEDEFGGTLRAESATLWDGFEDVELIDQVRAVQPQGRLDADRMRVQRGDNGRLRHALCLGHVEGEWLLDSASTRVASDELEVDWKPDGSVAGARLEGRASVSRGTDSISAPRIDALSQPDGWHLSAEETVYVQGIFVDGPGLLRAERLEASTDPAFGVRSAEAIGRVSYEGVVTRAEADRASYVADGPSGQIHLYGDDLRKARVGQGSTRVAADTIVTDPSGIRMTATGRVEATMLSGTAEHPGLQNRMFETKDAVHFVSETLESEGAGSKLTFRGSVRGWQGDRNLAADTMVVDQLRQTLEGTGNVSTRVPRIREGAAVAESDYLLIESDRLEYRDGDGSAVYQGNARLRFAEGWLEADRIEIWLELETSRIREVRAFDQITLEVVEIVDDPAAEAPPPTTGQADRLVYLPGEATIRLFGDKAPAVLQRANEGVATSGRVLRYRLDQQTFEVDSGDQGPASIRTSGN